MTAAHEIRGRLHAARLHLTYLERALAKAGQDPDAVAAARGALDEHLHLERLVLALLALAPRGSGDNA